MKVKRHYEKYWSSQVPTKNFFDYERNLELPSLFVDSKKILDLGCGEGAVASFLVKRMKLDVVGADISEKALKVARKRGIKVVLIDVEKKLPFRNAEFDTVFWGDNIEHLFEPQDTLEEISRVLKKGGTLILSCPNMSYWRYRIYYFLKGCLPDTEWTGNPPWGWSHIRFFNINILRRFLSSQGFTINKIVGVNRRFPDKYISKIFPNLFSMVLIIKAKKE